MTRFVPETEACFGVSDAASQTWRTRKKRNAIMFGSGGLRVTTCDWRFYLQIILLIITLIFIKLNNT